MTWSVFTTPSDVASNRATRVSRDYVLLKQILLNMVICVSIAAPSLWNKLPENIRSAETFAIFKKSLKIFLFKKYLC